jgi:hypothetical protein
MTTRKIKTHKDLDVWNKAMEKIMNLRYRLRVTDDALQITGYEF